MSTIQYKEGIIPSVTEIISLYENAQLLRPINDSKRLEEIYRHSNLVITAWSNKTLVGVARSITDWRWSCYLADLAVLQDYQNQGIGRKLIEITKQKVGDESMVLLLSVPTAINYYPKIGFTKQDRSFILERKK